jgi:hypothetical protein
MKDFKAEFEEWWEVIEEYFTKKLENNLTQHRVDEIFLKYKLNLKIFIYGNPISIKVLG